MQKDHRGAGLAAMLLIIAIGLSGCSDRYERSQGGRGLYTARTTLMAPTTSRKEMNDLMQLATSQRVLSRAAETLSDLGLKSTPEEILVRTSVTRVKDTNVIAVEVTLPKPEEAKVSADVIADEFKRAYGELNTAAFRQTREFIEAQLVAAKKQMLRANEELYDCRKSGARTKKQGLKLMELETEAEAAKAAYLRLRSEYDKTQVRFQAAQTRYVLRTIDQAVVFPARQ